MYKVGEPDSTGRIGVKVDTHRKMFNPYESRLMLPQGAQDELELKFTPEVIALYDQKKAERDAVIEPEPTPLTDEETYNRISRTDKAIIKTIGQLTGNNAAQMKTLIKSNM